MIREVSLVLTGANPKAGIEPELLHGEESEDAAFICCADENTAFVKAWSMMTQSQQRKT